MTFKEQLKKDLRQTFFNDSEFSQLHEFGGDNLPLIIDEEEIQKRRIKAAEGIYVGEKLIFISAEYFRRKPIEGRQITLDGESYFIVLSKEVDGIYEITLGVNEA